MNWGLAQVISLELSRPACETTDTFPNLRTRPLASGSLWDWSPLSARVSPLFVAILLQHKRLYFPAQPFCVGATWHLNASHAVVRNAPQYQEYTSLILALTSPHTFCTMFFLFKTCRIWSCGYISIASSIALAIYTTTAFICFLPAASLILHPRSHDPSQYKIPLELRAFINYVFNWFRGLCGFKCGTTT